MYVTRLKSTGEQLVILEDLKNPKTGRPMYRAKFPPQHPWHKPRLQNVNVSKTYREDSMRRKNESQTAST